MKGKCTQCGKVTDHCILRQGKKFCCMECVKKYAAGHPSKNTNVCEFC